MTGQRGLDSRQSLVDLTQLLRGRKVGAEGVASRLERATKVLVIAAVITVKKPIPSSISATASERPANDTGTLSPYPTVVTVCAAHQSPDPIDGNCSRSMSVINVPATRVIVVDTVAITTAAPRGVVARATHLSRLRSNRVWSAISELRLDPPAATWPPGRHSRSHDGGLRDR